MCKVEATDPESDLKMTSSGPWNHKGDPQDQKGDPQDQKGGGISHSHKGVSTRSK